MRPVAAKRPAATAPWAVGSGPSDRHLPPTSRMPPREARFIVDADVRLVATDTGRATGVVARVGDHDLTVRARAVVLAAWGTQHAGIAPPKGSWRRGRAVPSGFTR